MKHLIITGDDFGLAEPVNEAIVEGHRRGILTSASLMVGAASAQDAVMRARALPSLKVGLHLVVVEGRPVLAPERVPDLVGPDGEFSPRLVQSGFSFFFRRSVRKQLDEEIRAQFEAFQKTGLALDHVDAHNHMHLHPTILSSLLRIGKDFGIRSIRFPYEPPLPAWRADRVGLGSRLAWWMFLAPWLRLMKLRLHRAGIQTNDYLFGMAGSGRMTPDLVAATLREIPHGLSELYVHPATRRCAEIDRSMPDYLHEQEFKALLDPMVWEAVRHNEIERCTYSDLLQCARSPERCAPR